MSIKKFTIAFLLFSAMSAIPFEATPKVRIKDLATVEGVRSNPLIGYGLVVGLKGTGDGTQAEFTVQSLANTLLRAGVSVPQSAIRVKNVAAVMVTVELPPFVRPGQRLDVQVASIGDAKSLQGGNLLMTPLIGPDGKTYAVAQGAVSIGGAFLGGGGGNSVQKNHPTAGRIPSGGIIERSVPQTFAQLDELRLLLREPDFATAARLAAAINARFGFELARAEDAIGIRLDPPPDLAQHPVELLANVQEIELRPDSIAKIIINEKTGTVVMGNEVRISTVALAHGNLTVEVVTRKDIAPPGLFSDGQATIVPQTEVLTREGPNSVITLEEGVTVSDVVEALNDLGVSARDMIAIFQAMRAAGALYAEIVSL